MATIKAIKLISSTPIYSNLVNKSLITNEYKKFCPQLIIRTVKKRHCYKGWEDPHKPPKEFYAIPETVEKNERIDALRTSYGKTILPTDLEEMRGAYPEFFLSPNLEWRNAVLDKIARSDMLKRRAIIDIPEFYVGSIVAVTISDPYAPGKVSRFLGICIDRLGQGLFANFTLRNRIDNQGVEIRYDLYNPTVREIQVIRLEKRLDDRLLYLRDALPEYSYFPQDMAPEPHKPGEPVPVNNIQVEMKKWPWTQRWEWKNELRGIGVRADLPDWRYLMAWPSINQLEKYDLMKQYRETTSEDDLLEMLEQIKEQQEDVMEMRRVERRKKLLSYTSGDKPTERK